MILLLSDVTARASCVFYRSIGVVQDKEIKRSIEQINGEISAHLEKIVGRECVRLENYFKVRSRCPSSRTGSVDCHAHSVLGPRIR